MASRILTILQVRRILRGFADGRLRWYTRDWLHVFDSCGPDPIP
jgi:hypothetical protein